MTTAMLTTTETRRRHAVSVAWRRYLDACQASRREGTYEKCEPQAWARLERELAAAGVALAGEDDA